MQTLDVLRRQLEHMVRPVLCRGAHARLSGSGYGRSRALASPEDGAKNDQINRLRFGSAVGSHICPLGDAPKAARASARQAANRAPVSRRIEGERGRWATGRGAAACRGGGGAPVQDCFRMTAIICCCASHPLLWTRGGRGRKPRPPPAVVGAAAGVRTRIPGLRIPTRIKRSR